MLGIMVQFMHSSLSVNVHRLVDKKTTSHSRSRDFLAGSAPLVLCQTFRDLLGNVLLDL